MTEQQQILAAVADTYHLDTMYVFGSQCEKVLSFLGGGSERPAVPPSSDVDIAVRPIPGYQPSVRDKARLAAELEDLLQVSRVDLVLLPEADPFLAVNAIRGEPIYRRDKDRADEYELYLLRRAGDLAHLERERMAMTLDDA
jgi:predicted nucleotidyltransferase